MTSFTSQVVAGNRYGFNFENYEGTVYVWSQTWTGLL